MWFLVTYKSFRYNLDQKNEFLGGFPKCHFSNSPKEMSKGNTEKMPMLKVTRSGKHAVPAHALGEMTTLLIWGPGTGNS